MTKSPLEITKSAPKQACSTPFDATPHVKKVLLQAGLKVFSSRGYQRMTMENVLAEAGVSRPTLYKYFSNKHDLVCAALTEQIAHLEQHMRAAAHDEESSLYLVSRARLEAYYTWYAAHRDLMLQVYRELADPTSPSEKAREHLLGMVNHYWTAKLKQHGLTPNDPLEIDGLLYVMERLAMHCFALPADEHGRQRARFIDSTLVISGSYIKQLYEKQRPELVSSLGDMRLRHQADG